MEIPSPLIDEIALGRCLPFVGAGFSLNASLPEDLSMPDWPGLTAELRRTGGAPGNLDGPATAAFFERKYGRVQLIEAIRRALHSDDAAPGEAHKAFARLPFDTVYTTNFDLLLEDGYSAIGKPFRSLVGELQIPFHGGPLSTNVVKMHGDLRHEEHIVVTRADYESYLDRYPVIATHLSAMLITRTPLFIGYSLSDPDFGHIRNVIRSRLGQFERMAYIVQFNQPSERVEALLDERIHLINLQVTKEQSIDSLLGDFFKKVLEELDVRSGEGLRSARPDLFEELPRKTLEAAFEAPDASQLLASSSNLCFVLMPFGKGFDQVYEYLIRPAAQSFGLQVLRADSIWAPGSILEQTRSAIQQSRLCIADLTGRNPGVLYELGIAQTLGKPTVLLAQALDDVLFDLKQYRIIRYGLDEIEKSREALSLAIQRVLGPDQLAEAQRLQEMGMNRAAVAILGILLEHKLRELAAQEQEVRPTARLSIGHMLNILLRSGALDEEDGEILRAVVRLRNKAVHDMSEPTPNETRQMLQAVETFLKKHEVS